MDRAAAEKEAIRLWRNLPVQDRLNRRQATAFAAMIAPTLEFDAPERRAREIEAWLIRDLAHTDSAVTLSAGEDAASRLRLDVPAWPQREGAPALALVISLLVMIARRPDILSNAMFWAEDGAVYFAAAYNHGGLLQLVMPYAGYLEIFPRAVYGLATALPLRLAPLFGVWAALLIRAARPAFLFSSRFSWIDWRSKVAITAFYLLMPNLAEVHANVTNTQWYLGLYLLAVVVADPPRRLGWRVHDWIVLIISATTGPAAVLSIPVLVFRYFGQRGTPQARPAFFGAAEALEVVQNVILAASVTGAGLAAWPDANPRRFLEVMASRVILGVITPIRWADALSTDVIALPALVLGAVVIVAMLVRGPWRARGIALVPVLVVLLALYTPPFALARLNGAPVTGVMSAGYCVAAAGCWAMTLILFAATFLPRLTNEALAAVLLVAGLLILFDFPLPTVVGPAFGPEADRVAHTAAGETVVVPLAPPGWEM